MLLNPDAARRTARVSLRPTWSMTCCKDPLINAVTHDLRPMRTTREINTIACRRPPRWRSAGRLRSRTVAAWAVLSILVLASGCQPATDDWKETAARPECRPVDSAWAIDIQVTDAVTTLPVTDAEASTGAGGDLAITDSSGWACIRALAAGAETLQVRRPGYQTASTVLAGVPGQVLTRVLRYHRVPNPCCDLRGSWRVSFHLDSPAELGPRPTSRTVAGELELGPRILPMQAGDDMDSLVHVVRGLHHVDFRPFFGGPVAQDVSTSIFGEGPDLLHEVSVSIPMGDSVHVTFIPRMTHGSLSLAGRIRSDTIRGTWVQNAYCCGARGTFTMTRAGPADTTPFRPPSGTTIVRSSAHGPPGRPPLVTPAGQIPGGRWRPELALAPDGHLWLARDGLFVADSLFGPWRRVLGGNTDPVEADELRIGVRLAFLGSDTVLIGLGERYPMASAPVLYRTENDGATWSSVSLPNVTEIGAMSAIGGDVWLAAHRADRAITLLRSGDGGKTWSNVPVPRVHGIVVGLGLHRSSDSVAFLYGSTEDGQPSLWRTTDGGQNWKPLPAPHEQGLLKLEDYDSRIEEMATVGSQILVREHGRVFVSTTTSIRWRPLAHADHIASEVGGGHVFVLSDSLLPSLLNRDLSVIWQGDRPLQIRDPGDVEQVLVHNGVGFVSESRGAVHEIREGSARVVSPPGDQR